MADKRHQAPPKTSLDIGVLARKRVRTAFKVLDDVMRDKTSPAPSRVAAAKAVVEFGKIDASDLKKLDDVQLHELAKRIITAQSTKLAQQVKTAQDTTVGPLLTTKGAQDVKESPEESSETGTDLAGDEKQN
jgi:hypothetical protein